MTAQIIRGNALALPLANDSVDLCVTSPPYFGLRSYQDGGGHYDGQLGSEPTPAEFVAALISATREMVRVVKPSGSIFVNLGDKYSGAQAQNFGGVAHAGTSAKVWAQTNPKNTGVKAKSLIGIPWRYALACIDDLGLILRAEIIWSKPNGLPESVTDRVRRSHEQWFSFQQSGDEVMESGPQSFPFCPLCGRPKDARATLVRALHEVDAGIENLDLPNQVRANEWVQSQNGMGAQQPGVVSDGGSPVPLAVPGDRDPVEDAAHLLNDRQRAVVDQDAQVRAAGAAVAQGDTALSIDDPGEPGEVCGCSHPLIIDDEPWIPQSLAADLMQQVADGTADAQNVADFLSGNYARTHSTWFHFTLNPRYYSAVDEIREEHQSGAHGAARAARSDRRADEAERFVAGTTRGLPGQPGTKTAFHALGKLPGSVWSIPTQPLTVPAHLGVDHFAAFPMEWPRRIIRGWSPAGVCVACGEGRRPVVDVAMEPLGMSRKVTGGGRHDLTGQNERGMNGDHMRTRSSATITGYACACADTTAPTSPGVVLDPFGGTGTTALVAHTLGRHGISVDMSADYSRLARWRTTDPGQIAAAMQVDKPAPVIDGQGELFEVTA